ncbi:MAG: hypothetical protein ACRCXC_13445 [Legionella sp.]
MKLVSNAIQRTENPNTFADQQEQSESLRVGEQVSGSPSALILHQNPLKSHLLIQDTEFKATISFYQEWVKGAEKYYFSGTRADNDVLKAIYGKNSKYLNYFFESVYATSLRGEKQKREQLFTAFAGLDKPAMFLIPAKNMANVIMHLSDKYSDKDFTNYLTCLHSFFEQPMFHGLQPKLTDSDDLIKYGLLFEMVMKITSNHFVANDQRDTLKLLANLCQQIRRDFWDDFDEHLADDLAELFTHYPETTALLSESTLDFDLHHFIRLVNKNKDANPLVREERIDQLGVYLDKHHAELANGQLGVLRPLFQMVLGETQLETNKAPSLPEPHPMVALPNELQNDFWTFISQRQPVSQFELAGLTEILKGGVDSSDFKEHICKPLVQLPPYVSVSYIIDHLNGKVSQTNLSDAQRIFAQFEDSTKAFNQFAHQMGLITSVRRLSHNTHKSYAQFIELFNEMTLEQSQLFFGLCAQAKYAGAAIESTEHLGRAWLGKKVTGGVNELDEVLMLAVDISKLPESCKASVETAYKNSMTNLSLLPMLLLYVNKTKGSAISSTMMQAIWNACDTKIVKTEKELDSSIEFAKKALKYHALKDEHVNQVYQGMAHRKRR